MLSHILLSIVVCPFTTEWMIQRCNQHQGPSFSFGWFLPPKNNSFGAKTLGKSTRLEGQINTDNMPGTRIPYRSVKSQGRAHLACKRCRAHKIKCSGGKPTCRNCSVANKDCHYPGRDRIVTINESEIIKLQDQIKFYEQKQALSVPNFINHDDTDKEVNKGNFFHNATNTESSLFSFLDVDSEDEIIESSNRDTLRHYFNQNRENVPFTTSIVGLPDKVTALSLIGKVIELLGHEYYLFDAVNLVARVEHNYAKGLEVNDASWVSYLLITLAIGEQFSNDSTTDEIPGISYYHMFRGVSDEDFEDPSIQMIQRYLLLAFYQEGLNRSNSIFVTYGVATHLALTMGLHRKRKNLSVEEREKRRRVWWTCYVMDSIWAAKLGQPIHVDINDINVELEEIIDLKDGFNTSILKYNSELAIVLGKIMKKMYQPAAERTIGELLHCLQELSNYQKTLPKVLRENIVGHGDRTTANLYLRMNQLVIITTRPLILSILIGKKKEALNTPGIKQAVQKCVGSASANINILSNLKGINLFSNFGFWDAGYLFSALLILYMVSNGESYGDVIKIGRKLNKSMADSGNFTAVENEMRFKELDALFMKLKDQSTLNHDYAKQREDQDQFGVSPNTLLVDDIARIYGDVSRFESDTDFDGIFGSFPGNEMPEIWRDITSNFKLWDT